MNVSVKYMRNIAFKSEVRGYFDGAEFRGYNWHIQHRKTKVDINNRLSK